MLIKKLKSINLVKMYTPMYFTKELNKIQFIDSDASRKVDDLLMSEEIGYSIDQLMELAGYSVAISIDDAINKNWQGIKKILTIAGPGSIYLLIFKKTMAETDWLLVDI
jgi:hypothetical protein